MRTIVVLDDSADLGQLLCELLTLEPDVRCLALQSYEQLVHRAAEVLAAELVVLDVNLGPNVPSGVDAWEWLHRQQFTGHVVFLTGHAAAHPLVRRARAILGTLVLEKPVAVDVLLDVLQRRDPTGSPGEPV